jgi:hypothetical protein
MKRLLTKMKVLNLDALPGDERNQVLQAMQAHIVANFVSAIFQVKQVKARYSPTASTFRLIEAIIENARKSGKAGPVCEYLVGAKLDLKYPRQIRNKRYEVADAPGGYEGDFQYGNTVFHVTISPTTRLYEKAQVNTQRGYRVLLVVPNDLLAGVMQLAAPLADSGVGADSVELFVGRNLDEMAEFAGGEKLKSGFRRLLDRYNERVAEVDPDKSMLIEIPPNI